MSALETFLQTGRVDTSPAGWPDRFPPRMSPGQVATAARCPEQWRRKYVLRQREPWSGAALVGVAMHSAAELNFAQKIDSHEDLPQKDMLEIAAAQFDVKVEEIGRNDEITWRDVQPADAKDETVRLTDAYHRWGAPLVQPVAVEEWVTTQLEGMPELRGRVDVRTSTSLPDVKTSGRKTETPRGDWRLKALMYVLMTGTPFEWHVVTKTKVPAVYTRRDFPGLWLPATPGVIEVAEARYRATVAALLNLYDRFGPDEAWPTNAPEHDWACSYCSFRSSCWWWRS